MVALALALALALAAEPADATARYDAAMALLLDGKLLEAATAFEELARDPAAGPLAERARALADASRALAARGRFVPGVPVRAEPRPARPDRSGRAELTLFSTAWGIWTGVGIGVVAELEDPRAYLALALGGGGAGLATSILATRTRGMPSGRAQAIESAATWGGFNGGMLGRLAGAEEAREIVGATLGAGAAALGATVWLTSLAIPSSGDVALTNSGGLWGLAAGALTLGLIGSPTEDETLAVLVGFADAGLAAGALLSRRVEITRSRALLVDAGGLVGTLGGIAVPVFFQSEDSRVITGSGLVGMAFGLGLATWFTRGWDAHDDARAAGSPVAPFVTHGGGGYTFGFAGAF